MCYKQVKNVLDTPEPKGSHRLVKLVLAEHANEQGICWPSMTTIARRAAICTRQARRIVRDLERSGDLLVIKKGNGLRNPNTYQIHQIPPSTNSDIHDPVSDQTRTSKVPNEDTGVLDNADIAVSPKPSVNHQEPSYYSAASTPGPEAGAEFRRMRMEAGLLRREYTVGTPAITQKP